MGTPVGSSGVPRCCCGGAGATGSVLPAGHPGACLGLSGVGGVPAVSPDHPPNATSCPRQSPSSQHRTRPPPQCDLHRHEDRAPKPRGAWAEITYAHLKFQFLIALSSTIKLFSKISHSLNAGLMLPACHCQATCEGCPRFWRCRADGGDGLDRPALSWRPGQPRPLHSSQGPRPWACAGSVRRLGKLGAFP